LAKQGALTFSCELGLTPAELALASEETYALDDNGQAVAKPKFLRIRGNTLFALRLAARVAHVTFEPDRKAPGWQAFLDAIEVRNRITHPNSVEESTITDADLVIVRKAQAWFDSQNRAVGQQG